jgi:hypothetical protein
MILRWSRILVLPLLGFALTGVLAAGQKPSAASKTDESRDWWSLRPLVKPVPPVSRLPGYEHWAQTPVDQFILAKLREKNLRPSPPADRRTLLRRVTYDLTGLPPTLEELNAFVADETPQAFERVVDRLLASPHYGERWARHWMDVVHYAETHGHDQDRPRPNAWPYRDYLIGSFNSDKPYARFVQEQVAGDVLAPDDPQSIVATGMLATGPWDESSLRDIREDTVDREIARYIDRDDIVTTVMATFTSSTVHCARCHDHKFDPIKMQDYYALQAVFAGIDKAEREFDMDPRVSARRKQLLADKASIPAWRKTADPVLLTPALQRQVAAWEERVAGGALQWTILDPATMKSANGATLTRQPDLSVLASGKRPETDTTSISAHTDLQGISGIRLEVLTDDSLPHKGPGRCDNGNLHLNEIEVRAAPRDSLGDSKPVVLKNPVADFNQDGWTIAAAIDGNPKTAWGIYPQVSKPHRAIFEFDTPVGFPGGTTFIVALQQTHGGGHLIGRFRIAVTTAPKPLTAPEMLPEALVKILRVPAEERTRRQETELAAYVLEQQFDRELASLTPARAVYCGTSRFKQDGSFKPAGKPRDVHLLKRGDINKPGEKAVPGALACMAGLEAHFALRDANDEGNRRLALVRWLTDPKNVLTWRSIVNRVWHYHFGRGLVDTPNDFGHMGSQPTHPELLDWLAVTFQEQGGSFKKLHKLILMSATYQQAARHDAHAAEVDANDRYLWCMPRQRLDAESLRDAMLLAAGKLDSTMGGPSVKQFIQTPGVHVTPVVDYGNFDIDKPENQRRSVYRFIFRTLADPFMEALDCPDSSQLTPVRGASLTALQALAMLHDKFVVRMSEHLAERTAKRSPDLATQIRGVYMDTLLREPTEQELQAVIDYTHKHGLANACRLILNCNEFMFVN